MVSGLLGYVDFKLFSKYTPTQFSRAENVLLISVATATGFMPLTAVFFLELFLPSNTSSAQMKKSEGFVDLLLLETSGAVNGGTIALTWEATIVNYPSPHIYVLYVLNVSVYMLFQCFTTAPSQASNPPNDLCGSRHTNGPCHCHRSTTPYRAT